VIDSSQADLEMLRENTRIFADENIPLAEEGEDRAVVVQNTNASNNDDDDGVATADTGVSTADARKVLTQQAVNEGVIGSSRAPAPLPNAQVGAWGHDQD